MTERYTIVHKPTPPKREPFYDNLSDAIAALLDIQKSAQNPDEFVIVKSTEDDDTLTTVELRVREVRANENSPAF